MANNVDTDQSGSHANTAPENRATVASYEHCAADYAVSTLPEPAAERLALERFLALLPQGAWVLEIGSGPGWDADWLEGRGVSVRRTDAAAAPRARCISTNAAAERLDVVNNELGGPYFGIVALYIFQHIDRQCLPSVLTKLAHALDDEGVFLFALREGSNDVLERGDSGSAYFVAEWEKPDLEAILEPLGFRERWGRISQDADGRWLTMLTSRKVWV
jgi:hypothetical protein